MSSWNTRIVPLFFSLSFVAVAAPLLEGCVVYTRPAPRAVYVRRRAVWVPGHWVIRPHARIWVSGHWE